MPFFPLRRPCEWLSNLSCLSIVTNGLFRHRWNHDAFIGDPLCSEASSGIVLYMRLANERRRYIITSSLIGWAHIRNDPCFMGEFFTLRANDTERKNEISRKLSLRIASEICPIWGVLCPKQISKACTLHPQMNLVHWYFYASWMIQIMTFDRDTPSIFNQLLHLHRFCFSEICVYVYCM